MSGRVENGAELSRLVPQGSGGVAYLPGDASAESARAIEERGAVVIRSPWVSTPVWTLESTEVSS